MRRETLLGTITAATALCLGNGCGSCWNQRQEAEPVARTVDVQVHSEAEAPPPAVHATDSSAPAIPDVVAPDNGQAPLEVARVKTEEVVGQLKTVTNETERQAAVVRLDAVWTSTGRSLSDLGRLKSLSPSSTPRDLKRAADTSSSSISPALERAADTVVAELRSLTSKRIAKPDLYNIDVPFGVDSDEVGSAYKTLFDVWFAEKSNMATVVGRCSSDRTGTESYNASLAQRRKVSLDAALTAAAKEHGTRLRMKIDAIGATGPKGFSAVARACSVSVQ